MIFDHTVLLYKDIFELVYGETSIYIFTPKIAAFPSITIKDHCLSSANCNENVILLETDRLNCAPIWWSNPVFVKYTDTKAQKKIISRVEARWRSGAFVNYLAVKLEILCCFFNLWMVKIQYLDLETIWSKVMAKMYLVQKKIIGWVHLSVIWQWNWKYCVEFFNFFNGEYVLFGSRNN